MRFRILLTGAAVVLLSACSGGGGGTASPSATLTPATTHRPASPVKVTLVSPTNGEVVHGTSVYVVVAISGGTVTTITSTHISPTRGHVHLYLNNRLVYMSYTLHQYLPVQPGFTYAMYAEWVASDHFPFDPRDVTPTIFFTVAAA